MHSHSGALGSRGDRAAAILGELAGLSTSSLGSAACRLLLGLLSGVTTLSGGDGLGVLLVLVDGPVEDVVILEALADEEIAEDLAEVGVVWLVVEAQAAGVVEVDGELVREATAENLGRSSHLLLHDAVVLLLFGGRLKTLPWERTTAEVQHDVTQRLHVVAAGLL